MIILEIAKTFKKVVSGNNVHVNYLDLAIPESI